MRKLFLNNPMCAVMVLIFLSTLLLSACTKPGEQSKKSEQGSVSTPPPLAPVPSPAVEVTKGSLNLRTAIIQVAQNAIPAVAHVEVTERQTVSNPFLPFENDPFFHFFFNFPKEPRKFKRELKGLGSGDDPGFRGLYSYQ